jgi:hypothetical protein
LIIFSGRDAGGAGGVGGSGWAVVGVALDSSANDDSNGTKFVVYRSWQWQFRDGYIFVVFIYKILLAKTKF